MPTPSHDEHGDAFYAKSDAERRAGPQPPIDRNSYARENGWAIASLAALYDVTGDTALLDAAAKAFDWMLANRRAPNGGFGHGRAADDDTHLGDTLAMAEAALALYRSTAERRYLALATEFGEVIVRDHRDPAGGFMVRQPEPGAKGVLAKPVKQVDENVATTRLFNLLARNTGRPDFRQPPEHGMRYLIALAEDDLVVPGALLADRELAREPAHVTIVGAKDDPAAQALYAAARSLPDALPAHRMARPPRGPVAGGRRRLSRDARSGGLRLRQRRLLGAGFHAGRRSTHRRQGRRPLGMPSAARIGAMPISVLRVARPSDDIDALLPFYRDGLGLAVLYRFEDHDGFDGVMLGHEKAPYHFEFTRARGHIAGRAPTRTTSSSSIFRTPPTGRRPSSACVAPASQPVPAFNPYWDREGVTFEDPDGYRVVFQRAAWTR